MPDRTEAEGTTRGSPLTTDQRVEIRRNANLEREAAEIRLLLGTHVGGALGESLRGVIHHIEGRDEAGRFGYGTDWERRWRLLRVLAEWTP